MNWISYIAGLFSGILSGMGIGGGTILIPALTLFLKIGQHTAQGVNLLYFIPTAAVALFIHRKNNQLVFQVAIPVILFGILGAVGGSFLALKLKSEILRKLFGFFLFLMGAYEVYKGFRKKT